MLGRSGVIEKKFSSMNIPNLTTSTFVLKLGVVDYYYECGSIRRNVIKTRHV